MRVCISLEDALLLNSIKLEIFCANLFSGNKITTLKSLPYNPRALHILFHRYSQEDLCIVHNNANEVHALRAARELMNMFNFTNVCTLSRSALSLESSDAYIGGSITDGFLHRQVSQLSTVSGTLGSWIAYFHRNFFDSRSCGFFWYYQLFFSFHKDYLASVCNLASFF